MSARMHRCSWTSNSCSRLGWWAGPVRSWLNPHGAGNHCQTPLATGFHLQQGGCSLRFNVGLFCFRKVEVICQHLTEMLNLLQLIYLIMEYNRSLHSCLLERFISMCCHLIFKFRNSCHLIESWQKSLMLLYLYRLNHLRTYYLCWFCWTTLMIGLSTLWL